MRPDDRHARAERRVRDMRSRFSAISRRADRRAFFRRYTVWLVIAGIIFAGTLWGTLHLLSVYDTVSASIPFL